MGPVAFMISWALAVARRPHGAPPIRTSALWAFPSNMVESQLIKIHMAVDLWNYKFAWPSTMDLSCCPKEIEWIFQDSLFWTVGLLSHPIMRTNININRKQSDIFPGGPCTPFSPMGLGEGENDVVFECHKKYYETVGDVADLAICENVKESKLEETMSRYLGVAWDVKASCVDPRLFGLGCARARCYGIGWKKSSYEWSKLISLERVLGALKAQPVMKADDYFFLTKTPEMKLSPAEDSQFVCNRYMLLLPKNILTVLLRMNLNPVSTTNTSNTPVGCLSHKLTYNHMLGLLLRKRTERPTWITLVIGRWQTCPSWFELAVEGRTLWKVTFQHLQPTQGGCTPRWCLPKKHVR